MLNWANRFSISVFLDSNEYRNLSHPAYECLLAVKPFEIFSANEEADILQTISAWHEQNKDWLFGHISYDYKNKIFGRLSSQHIASFSFPDAQFFCPEVVCFILHSSLELCIETLQTDPEDVWNAIQETAPYENSWLPEIDFQKRISKKEYIETVMQLKEHIRNGDCYEINFCNEGFAENILLHPSDCFCKLNQIAPAPFAAYYRVRDQYMCCSSPERYLKKSGDTLIAQPIKGTIKRSENETLDKHLKEALFASEKDRAENVMIVDLMRNDLSKSCETGSIQVNELFGIYSFPSVHQMISTVTGKLRKDIPLMNAVLHSFPMGSMTGAPKIKVMELIEHYEKSKRELFSGCIGYINPGADFDFNVIIRSLFYNARTHYLSYQTGGAITFDSDPMSEWEEMQLKAFNLEKLFSV